MNMKRILDVGCGLNKVEGAIGVDIVKLPTVDIICDLNQYPYPFKDNSFGEIYARQIIEHLEDIPKFMDEIWRILKPKGVLHLETVHYTSHWAVQDPTHKHLINTTMFEYFDGRTKGKYQSAKYMCQCNFEIKTYVTLVNFWKYLGFEYLVNLVNKHRCFRFIRNFWEQNLCFIIRGKWIKVHAIAIK